MYFFFAGISPEMKACKVLTYHLVLLVLQRPICQVQGPILEILSKSSLTSAFSPKRKQFKWSRWTNPEREIQKGIVCLRSCIRSRRELGRGLGSPDPQTRALATWQSPVSLSDPPKSPEVSFIFNLALKVCKKDLQNKWVFGKQFV